MDCSYKPVRITGQRGEDPQFALLFLGSTWNLGDSCRPLLTDIVKRKPCWRRPNRRARVLDSLHNQNKGMEIAELQAEKEKLELAIAEEKAALEER